MPNQYSAARVCLLENTLVRLTRSAYSIQLKTPIPRGVPRAPSQRTSPGRTTKKAKPLFWSSEERLCNM